MTENILYLAMRDGECEYASASKMEAENFVEQQYEQATNEVLNEWGIDDPSVEDIDEAAFQAGYDENYEVVKVDMSKKTEDDTIELPDGNEVEVSDILEKLK